MAATAKWSRETVKLLKFSHLYRYWAQIWCGGTWESSRSLVTSAFSHHKVWSNVMFQEIRPRHRKPFRTLLFWSSVTHALNEKLTNISFIHVDKKIKIKRTHELQERKSDSPTLHLTPNESVSCFIYIQRWERRRTEKRLSFRAEPEPSPWEPEPFPC